MLFVHPTNVGGRSARSSDPYYYSYYYYTLLHPTTSRRNQQRASSQINAVGQQQILEYSNVNLIRVEYATMILATMIL